MSTDMNRVLLCACEYAAVYRDSNPDVGMGPSADSILEDVLEEVKIPKASYDEAWILNRLTAFMKRSCR
jgi:hypothetical protein